MAEERIVQNLIRRLGQSQPERSAPELREHFANIDERDPRRLFEFATRLAPLVRFYGPDDNPAGDWTPFFRPHDTGRVIDGAGHVTPHLALFGAFLQMYEQARGVMNRLTAAHLAFFYERVLGFSPRPALPDRAHLLVEPKNNAAPVRIGPGHRLTAGKGPQGERLYAPVAESVVRGARVVSLRSLFVDGRRAVQMAPIANSADGLGGEWDPSRAQHWNAFGSASLPHAPLGFAIASPVLRMAEGQRTITCLLRLDHVDVEALNAEGPPFDAYVTGTRGWLGPYRPASSVEGGALALTFGVAPEEPAVVDYDAAIHGLSYTPEAPVVQFLFRGGDRGASLESVERAVVRGTRVRVSVSGITSLALASDAGPLDPKRAFLPFGPLPDRGSRFLVESAEALSKKLSALTVRVRWLGVPSFATQYKDYSSRTYTADDFTAAVWFRDAAGWEVRASAVPLFDTGPDGWVEFRFDATGVVPPSTSNKGRQVHALGSHQDKWARQAEREVFGLSHSSAMSAHRATFDRSRIERYLDARTSEPPRGAITFTLNRDFLHETYRRRTIENAFADKDKRVVLREPYTPNAQGIELEYTASTAETDVSAATLEAFSQPDVAFFHVDAFGQRREHGYRRARMPFVGSSQVPLVPTHPFEGELLIGLEGVAARDTISLLIQAAEATADPDLPPAQVEWAALCDNDWKPLRPEELIADGSREFRRSGVVSLVIPREATTVHTVMPSGMTWLRAAVAEHSRATCQLVAVEASALEAVRVAPEAAADHVALAPGSIAKLKTPLAGIKSVKQPYVSIGGRPTESPSALYVRASERLRHKDRAITAWDYERLVLEAFPAVHRVKCVPHARDGAWLAPGHVLLVVVPDLRNRLAQATAGDHPRDPTEPVPIDLLQPRVDIDTLTSIQAYLRERCGSQIDVHVKNPLYQKVRLAFEVKFARGRDFHYHRRRLSNDILRFLSPWAFEGASRVSFGGVVFRSVLLDFVEELDYVDYLLSFRMFTESAGVMAETAEAVPARPDAILVSDVEHSIGEAA
jgi:hypothetical protein